MNVYLTKNSLRIVGKSWQVRAKLKQLSQSNLTVQQFLQLSKEESVAGRREPFQVIK